MTSPSEEPGTPIVASTRVETDPEHAFEMFTRRFGAWWDPRLTANAETYEGAEVPDAVGGVVHLLHSDGSYPIGAVTEYEPVERFVMSFHLALPKDHPTTLSVTFEPADDGTLVTLTHGGWTEGNVHRWANFNEWPLLLERFAEAADGEP